MVRKIFLVMFMLVLSVSVLSAEKVIWGSNYEQGNVTLGVDIGSEWGPDWEISAYPTVEMILYKPDFGELAFLDLGAKALGRIGVPLIYPGFDLGVGLAGTAHFGFKGLDIPGVSDYLDLIDLFLEVGICFDIFTTSTFPLGMVLNSGVNYWVSDNIALGLKYSSWNQYDGGTIGLLIKFGSQKAAEKAVEKAGAE